MAVSEWSIPPSEYWQMSPAEVGEIMRFNTPPEMHAGKHVEFWDDLVERSNNEGFI
jgi:hypothetical protein